MKLVPLEPGRFHVRVVRGPQWGSGDGDVKPAEKGTVIVPTIDHCTERLIAGNCCDGGGKHNPKEGLWDGGWWLTRSAVVKRGGGHTAFLQGKQQWPV